MPQEAQSQPCRKSHGQCLGPDIVHDAFNSDDRAQAEKYIAFHEGLAPISPAIANAVARAVGVRCLALPIDQDALLLALRHGTAEIDRRWGD